MTLDAFLPAKPIIITADDGDVPNAVVAYFGEAESSHIRFAIDAKSRVRLLGIWRDPDDQITRGQQMVAWLRSATNSALLVDEVAESAVGFWERMLETGLIDSWTESPFKGRSLPVDIDTMMLGSFQIAQKSHRPK